VAKGGAPLMRGGPTSMWKPNKWLRDEWGVRNEREGVSMMRGGHKKSGRGAKEGERNGQGGRTSS
jgi:hypothetical protein